MAADIRQDPDHCGNGGWAIAPMWHRNHDLAREHIALDLQRPDDNVSPRRGKSHLRHHSYSETRRDEPLNSHMVITSKQNALLKAGCATSRGYDSDRGAAMNSLDPGLIREFAEVQASSAS
jgi:hypothetical protein